MNGVKKCCRCGETKSINEFGKDVRRKDGLKSFCKKCHNVYNKKYLRPITYLRDYYAKNKKKMLSNQKEYGKIHPEVHKKSSKKYRYNLIIEGLKHYGGNPPKCACCGETEIKFLTIDHINGFGNRHRKQIKKNLYLWLKENGYPKEGFQVLCFNCNMGKNRNDGICPHVHQETNPDRKIGMIGYGLNLAKFYTKESGMQIPEPWLQEVLGRKVAKFFYWKRRYIHWRNKNKGEIDE